MPSIRQQIIDALAARLATIGPATTFTLSDGPYTCGTTLGGGGVVGWRKVAVSPAQCPAINFYDDDVEITGNPIGHHEHRMTVTIVGLLAGSDGLEDGRQLMADIVAVIGSDPRWGGLANWTDIEQQNISMEQMGDICVGCDIRIAITYRTTLWRM